jgi:anti-repressor protein
MDLQVFDFDGSAVRIVMVDGDPWWVAADVARSLGFDKAGRVLRLLDDDEKGDHIVATPGGDQSVGVVNESGLYSLVIRSNKPEAKRFKRWVTHEVLPSIRKTGTYSVPPARSTDIAPSDVEGLLVAALAKIQSDRLAIAEQAKAISALEPKAEAWVAMIDPSKDYSIDDAAKHMCRDGDIVIGERKLFAWMRERGHIIRKKDRGREHDMPSQRHIDAGRLAVRIGDQFWNEKNQKYEQGAPQVRIPGRALAYWLKVVRRDGRFAKKPRRQTALVEADP